MGDNENRYSSCRYCGTKLLDGDTAICSACSADKTVAPQSDTLGRTASLTIPPQCSPSSGSLQPKASDGQPQSNRGLERFGELIEITSSENLTQYQATHPTLDRKVLVSVLDLTHDESFETRNGFFERAKALSNLAHPSLPAMMEAGVDGQRAFIVQENIEARPITGFQPRNRRQRWCEGFFPAKKLAWLMLQAAEAMRAMHEQGIAHGHLSTSSLLLDQYDELSVTGLLKTSQFESPNGMRQDIVDFGATFVEIVTGDPDFEILERYDSHAIEAQIKSRNPGIPKKLCQLMACCLSSDEKSLPDIQTLVAELRPLANRQTQRASWRTRFFSLAIGMVACSITISLLISLLIGFAESDSSAADLLLLSGILGLVFYVTATETVFGSTPIRRLFGMQLFDHAGDPAHWLRRLGRSCGRFGILVGSALAVAMTIPLLATISDSPLWLLLASFLALVLPFLLTYGSAWYFRSRWTLYDLMAGATWGEIESSRDRQAIGSSDDEAEKQHGAALDRVDQFTVYRSLGAGGMGNVYLARDETLHRDAALKVLAGHLTDSPDIRQRFAREARLAARISHPNVARIYGDGIWNNAPYIAMELVDGCDLDQHVRDGGPLRIGEAWASIIQAAEALHAAAKLGVIHRDIKPANLMRTPAGQIKVMDFGISREIQSEVEVTQAGAIIGTPTYMSPEQAKGEQVDFRSDIYSLGLTLYFLLTGKPPFRGDSAMQILASKMDGPPESLLGKIDGMTAEQNRVLDKMIAKDADARYSDYESLLADLHEHDASGARLGSVLKRIAAEVCNIFGFYAMAIVMIGILLAVAPDSLQSQQRMTNLLQGITVLVYCSFIAMYIWGIARRGITSGKRLLNLKVVRPEGDKPDFARSTLRFLVAYPFVAFVPVSWLINTVWKVDLGAYYVPQTLIWINLATLIVSIVLMSIHPQRRTLHDLAADTIVIQRK